MDVTVQPRLWPWSLRAGLLCCLLVATLSATADEQPILSIKKGKGTAGEDDEKSRDQLVSAKAFLSVDKLPAGRSCEILVLVDIRKNWHINQNPPEPKYLIPTKLSIATKHGSELQQVKYPAGSLLRVEGISQPLKVYENQLALRGLITVPKSAAGQTEEMEIVINYQACNDKECKPPTKLKLAGKVPVAGPTEKVNAVNQKYFPKERS